MNVLVTGNLGYIGSAVVKQLRATPFPYITGLDRGWFLSEFAEPPCLPDEQLFADLRDSVPYPPANPHTIVHMAGLSNDPLGDLDPKLTEEINTKATLRLVRRYPRARHVVISSCSVYGFTDAIATEETPVAPLTPYAKAKADVDRYLELADFDYVSLRLGTVYGYAPGYRLDLVVNKMCWDASFPEGKVYCAGNAQRPLVHVDDVARAVEMAVVGEIPRGVYNVVGENWHIRDLGRAVANAAGAPLERVATADKRDYSASADKLLARGWKPTRTVRDTIPELLRLSSTLPIREYRRLPALQRLIDTGRLDAQLRENFVAQSA